MKSWPKLIEARPLDGYRLRLTWADGFVGAVDFTATVAKGGIYAFMRDPVRFAAVQVGPSGSSLVWIDDEDDEIDFCADAQRMAAETRAVANLAAE